LDFATIQLRMMPQLIEDLEITFDDGIAPETLIL
jgi:hypothetical protein